MVIVLLRTLIPSAWVPLPCDYFFPNLFQCMTSKLSALFLLEPLGLFAARDQHFAFNIQMSFNPTNTKTHTSAGIMPASIAHIACRNIIRLTLSFRCDRHTRTRTHAHSLTPLHSHTAVLTRNCNQSHDDSFVSCVANCKHTMHTLEDLVSIGREKRNTKTTCRSDSRVHPTKGNGSPLRPFRWLC